MSSRPNAVTYANSTSARSNARSIRPVGYARNRCRRSAAGSRSHACPIVCSTGTFVQARLETNIAKPARIIKMPKRLSGRRHHATSPPKMYGSVTQSMSVAWRPGSRTWSLVSAKRNDREPALKPSTTIDQITAGGGARAPAGLGTSAAATVAMDLAPFSLRDCRRTLTDEAERRRLPRGYACIATTPTQRGCACGSGRSVPLMSSRRRCRRRSRTTRCAYRSCVRRSFSGPYRRRAQGLSGRARRTPP